MTGMFISVARQGPTCAVSPSTDCLPHRIRLGSVFSIARDKIYAVAKVSDPAKAGSDTKIARTPSRVILCNAERADFGHILITVILPPILSAHSSAASSKGFGSPFAIFIQTVMFILSIPRCTAAQARHVLFYRL